MSRALYAFAFALALCLALPLGGCYGPTLPLPPPTALVSAPDAMGVVELSGEALPDAYVLALNLDTDGGVIGRADPTGRYTMRVSAEVGNTIEVWQMTSMDGGQHRTVIVPAP
ncbi:MAG: hypothetical protein J0L92_39140 [Deltaproteobacteria bacterium]|nr:hypothetical protein [Deltaproteobacteria bacterium]